MVKPAPGPVIAESSDKTNQVPSSVNARENLHNDGENLEAKNLEDVSELLHGEP